MLALLLNLLLLVSACVATHSGGMILGVRWLWRLWPRDETDYRPGHTFWLIVRVVYGLLLLHLIQITIWAAFYQFQGCFADFATSFYFSATSYSTLGYGDVLLDEKWRILGAVEAVTGVLMFGWSTGILFTIVHHLLSRVLRRTITQHPEH
ncbi:two pore domain potassium channel family protein [Luteolibacter yonseiensis]|uniref:Two pore domain potassium channel family protein n=1 Tax=Luteolibacter yonseiensis TaxID=1144680 RepID=A0A934R315_9BACT|nr:potassium channel family protein [Luteolibacter yonseiensis]MBK1814575.1 two pore domain potassium channel family protein [Luteolibacter yonseiensis]